DWMTKWDKFYERLSEEKKKYWTEELAVHNNAQYITKTVYTKERLEEWGANILKNIREAGYNI
ncbi:MAG: hypothetical protein U9O98_04005, partial [Asgard group archaeon]|nr:hypothetical protein [Asgard group archaeon]